MKFLTLTLAALLTLAFSFTAVTPAEADLTEADLKNLAKCRVYNAKIRMNYAKCLELDNLLVEKGKDPKGICDSKRTTSLEKATAKFVTKLSVDPTACGIDTDTADAQRDVQLLASANSESACETAGGTWESGTCTAAPPAVRGCFLSGACGADGFNFGDFAGVTKDNSGCNASGYASETYDNGAFFFDPNFAYHHFLTVTDTMFVIFMCQ